MSTLSRSGSITSLTTKLNKKIISSKNNNAAIVLLHNMLRLDDNPMIHTALQKHTRVYILYILDTNYYGRKNKNQPINELGFILDTIAEMDMHLRIHHNSKIFFYYNSADDNQIITPLNEIIELDKNITTIYTDVNNTLVNIKAMFRINKYIKRTKVLYGTIIKLIKYDSSHALTKTWKKNDIKPYKQSLRIAKSSSEFISAAKNLIDTKSYIFDDKNQKLASFTLSTKNEMDIISTIKVYRKKHKRTILISGRQYALSLLAQDEPVWAIYSHLHFGTISAREFISSPAYSADDYLAWVYTQKKYQAKRFDSHRNTIRGAIDQAEIYKRLDNLNTGYPYADLLMKKLKYEGVLTSTEFVNFVIIVVRNFKMSWINVELLLQNYLIGYNPSFITNEIHEILRSRHYPLDIIKVSDH